MPLWCPLLLQGESPEGTGPGGAGAGVGTDMGRMEGVSGPCSLPFPVAPTLPHSTCPPPS